MGVIIGGVSWNRVHWGGISMAYSSVVFHGLHCNGVSLSGLLCDAVDVVVTVVYIEMAFLLFPPKQHFCAFHCEGLCVVYTLRVVLLWFTLV